MWFASPRNIVKFECEGRMVEKLEKPMKRQQGFKKNGHIEQAPFSYRGGGSRSRGEGGREKVEGLLYLKYFKCRGGAKASPSP